MAPNVPLTLEQVVELSAEDLVENVDDVLEVLSSADVDTENNTDKLKKLLQVSVTALEIKSEAARAAEEELQNVARKEATDQAYRVEELEMQVQKLEKENAHLKTYGGDSGAPQDVKYLKNELRDLEHQRDNLAERVKELEEERDGDKFTNEKLSSRVEQAEKEAREFRKEANQLRDDLREYEKQFELQMETLQVRHGADGVIKDQLRRKTLELAEVNEENVELREANEKLQKQVVGVKEKLSDAVREMEQNTEAYEKLKKALTISDTTMENLQRENAILKSAIGDYKNQVEEKADLDDEIVSVVNSRVDQWKQAIKEKESLITKKDEEIFNLHQKLSTSSTNSEKIIISNLNVALNEKETQLQYLKSKLEEATREIKDMTSLLQSFNKSENGHKGDAFQKLYIQIAELKDEVKKYKTKSTDLQKEWEAAENHALMKDEELTDALSRLGAYESGVYGLKEAVNEIKKWKEEIKRRDSDIQELVKQLNKIGLEKNDLLDDNDALREKLGLDSNANIVRSSEVGFNREDGYKGENIVLQQRVEELEEKNLDLFRKLRHLARQAGEKGVQKGLTLDNMMNTYMTEKNKQQNSNINKSNVEVEDKNNKVTKLEEKNKALQEEIDRMRKEQRELEKGMQEIEKEMKEYNSQKESNQQSPTTQVVIRCPSLQKYLSIRHGEYSENSMDKPMGAEDRMDLQHLQGRYDETKDELEKARQEISRLSTNVVQSEKIKRDEDIKGSERMEPILQVPKTITSTSSGIIACLNDYTLKLLGDNRKLESLLQKLDASLESSKNNLAVTRHQMGLIYTEYRRDKDIWRDEKNMLTEEKERQLHEIEKMRVEVEEYHRLVDTLEQDGDEMKRRVGEVSRRIAVVGVNERTLLNKVDMLTNREEILVTDNNKLQRELLESEKAGVQKVAELRRHGMAYQQKIRRLETIVEDSVRKDEYDEVQTKYKQVNNKYRQLVEERVVADKRRDTVVQVETQLAEMSKEHEKLKGEWRTDRQKVHVMESILENLKGQGVVENVAGLEEEGLARRLALLEVKELNERERANHATSMLEQHRALTSDMEKRNMELERKISDMTQKYLDLQAKEDKLRVEVSEAVSKDELQRNKQRVEELEEKEIKLREEVSRLKEVADVASYQSAAIEQIQSNREKEVTMLRERLIATESESIDLVREGKMKEQIHEQQRQLTERNRKNETLVANNRKLEVQIIQVDNLLKEREDDLFRIKQDKIFKVSEMRRRIHELEMRYGGGVPIEQLERMASLARQLQMQKDRAQTDMERATEERYKVEEHEEEMKMKLKHLQELLDSVERGTHVEKLREWMEKVEEVKLAEMKERRKCQTMEIQFNGLKEEKKLLEEQIGELEGDKARLHRDTEGMRIEISDREEREDRLVEALKQVEKNAMEVERMPLGKQITPPEYITTGGEQLDHANTTIHRLHKEVEQAETEIRRWKNKAQEVASKLHNVELALVEEKQSQLGNVLNKQLETPKGLNEEVIEEMQHKSKLAMEAMMKMMQNTVNQKEKTIQRNREMMEKLQNELKDQMLEHEKQIEETVKDVEGKYKSEIDRLKRRVENAHSKVGELRGSADYERMNELEDLVAQQEDAINQLTTKLVEITHKLGEREEIMKKREDDHGKWKNEKERQYEERVRGLVSEIEEYRVKNEKVEGECESLRNELKQRRVERPISPATLRLVDQVKAQLSSRGKKARPSGAMLPTQQHEGEDEVTEGLEKGMKEIHTMTKELKHTKDQLRKSKIEGKQLLEQNEQLKKENEVMKRDMRKMAMIYEQIKEDKENAEERCREVLKKLKSLEEKEVKAEKPYEYQIQEKEQMARWEEKKKWEKVTENLKNKLSERQEKIKALDKLANSQREALVRADKDKSALEMRLQTMTFNKGGGDSNIKMLLDKITGLEKENEKLQRRSDKVTNGEVVEKLREQVHFYKHKLEELERKMVKMKFTALK